MNSLLAWTCASAALVALAACGTTRSKEYTGPDGSAIKTTKCQTDQSGCYINAANGCAASGGTYRVVSSDMHAGGIFADWLPGR